MGLVWAAVIAAAVFVQKVVPLGEGSAKVMGVALLVAAAYIAAV